MDKKTFFMRYVSNTPTVIEPEWHTVFSGSKKLTVGNNGTLVSNLPSNVQLFRMTGTCKLYGTAHEPVITLYKNNAVTYTAADDNKTVTITDKEFTKIVLVQTEWGGGDSLTITYDSTNNTLSYKSTGTPYYQSSITFTKIEALY